MDHRAYRERLIESGALVPREARLAKIAERPTLRLDDHGRAAAERHMKQGDYGRKVLHVPPEYWRLPPWHVEAIEKREARIAEFNRFLKKAWPEPGSAFEGPILDRWLRAQLRRGIAVKIE